MNLQEQIELTVMLPAYNEGATLQQLLPAINEAAASISPAYEILILDTQIAMDTEEICAKNGVRHLRRAGGNRYGDAIRTGIAQARGKYLLCTDADGSPNPGTFAACGIREKKLRYRHWLTLCVGGTHRESRHIDLDVLRGKLTFRVVFKLRAKM
jgi:glycosyltransferase involved in cell wall biosynthesis